MQMNMTTIEKIGEDLEGGLSLNQGEISSRLRELSGSKTFGANFDLAERGASLEAFQKELNSVMEATRSFRAEYDPIFGIDDESIGVGTLRNTETGRLLGGRDPAQLREFIRVTHMMAHKRKKLNGKMKVHT